MKKHIILFLVIIMAVGTSIVINGCAASEKLTSKTGAELWSLNCVRCHNAPDPADYSDPQWEAIGIHMKLRTNSLTDDEVAKIVDFLKSAN